MGVKTLVETDIDDEIHQLQDQFWKLIKLLATLGVGYSDSLCTITYLIFLKMNDELTQLGEPARLPAFCQWHTLLTTSDAQGREVPLSPEQQLEHFEEILATLAAPNHPDDLIRNIFAKAQNKIDNPVYLGQVIGAIDAIAWLDLRIDVKGALYEFLLEKNGQDRKSGSGQYFTPRVLVQVLTELIDPHLDELVWDPACGTGGFLLAALDHVRALNPPITALEHFMQHGLRGQDNTSLVVTMAAMNLFLHGFEGKFTPILLGDSLLGLPERKADVILANPPFGTRARGALTIERADFIIKSQNNQLNFLQHIMSLLKVGGRAAVIVPEGVLFDKEGGAIRRALLTQFNLHTILILPQGIFYSDNIKTFVLFFTKGEPTSELWYYDLRTNSSFSRVKNPLKRSDLDDFVQCYAATGRSGFGERHEIYDAVSAPDGRWRKFSAAQFLSDKFCRLMVPSWLSAPKSEIEQMDLAQLLVEMDQTFRACGAAFGCIYSELTGVLQQNAKQSAKQSATNDATNDTTKEQFHE